MVRKSLFALLLLVMGADPAAPTGQDRIRDLLRNQESMAVVLAEVDHLMRSEPTCKTATFLANLLMTDAAHRRLTTRIARLFSRLTCEEEATARLRTALNRRAAELGLSAVVDRYLGSRPRETDPMPNADPEPRLRVRSGFSVVGGDFRASFSPSGRYLAVGSMADGGRIDVWDLYLGVRQRSLSYPFTFLSVFLTDHLLLVSGAPGFVLWDFLADRQRVLMGRLFQQPSFITVGPHRDLVAVNSRKGDLNIYDVLGIDDGRPDFGGVRLEPRFSLSDMAIQSVVFADDENLLLGTEDWQLLNLDVTARAITAATRVDTVDDWPTEVRGDLTFEAMRVLNRGRFGVRQVAVSDDGQHVAAVTNGQVVLLRRSSAGFEKSHTLTADRRYNFAFFMKQKLIALNGRQGIYLDVTRPEIVEEPLAEEVRNATWGTAVSASVGILVGSNEYTVYDFHGWQPLPYAERHLGISMNLNTWLLPGGDIMMYSSDQGLRRVRLARLKEVVRGEEVSPVELLYRSGLIHADPPSYLTGLAAYRDAVYWLEKHEERLYFVTLIAAGGRNLPRIVELPADLQLFPAEMYKEQYFQSRIREFRAVRAEGFPLEMKIDMHGIGEDLLLEMMLGLQGYHRVAFNGESVAIADDDAVVVVPVGAGPSWRIPTPDSQAQVILHPEFDSLLVVWSEHEGVEIWDLKQRLRRGKIALPRTKPRRMAFNRDGSTLAIAASDRVHIIDLAAQEVRTSVRFGSKTQLFGLDLRTDGEQVLVTGYDQQSGHDLFLIDAATGKKKELRVGGTFGMIGDAIFWPNDHHILERNLIDNRMNLYRLDENGIETALTLMVLDDGEAAIFDPQNRHWSTLEGYRYLIMEHGPWLSHVDQFPHLADAGRDDLVAALGGAETGGVPPVKPSPPPRVVLKNAKLSPFFRSPSTSDSLTVELSVSGSEIVKQLDVRVNGVRRQTLPIGAREMGLEVEVGLAHGHNEITFVALDAADNTSYPLSYPLFVTAAGQRAPRLWFLGIGVDDGDAEFPLSYPHADAQYLSRLFAGIPTGKYWSQVDVRVPSPEDLTPDGIHTALATVAEELSYEDLLIVYLAGHGSRAKKTGEFAFATAGGPLRWRDFGQWLGEVKSRIIVLLDACHAGSLGRPEATSNDRLAAELFDQRGYGLLVFSASRSWQETYEWPRLKRGNFAHAMTAGFSASADLNHDAVISLREFAVAVGDEAERVSRAEFDTAMDYLRKLYSQGAFHLGEMQDVAQPADESFSKIIKMPHRPWLARLDSFGDIPLIPIDVQP